MWLKCSLICSGGPVELLKRGGALRFWGRLIKLYEKFIKIFQLKTLLHIFWILKTKIKVYNFYFIPNAVQSEQPSSKHSLLRLSHSNFLLLLALSIFSCQKFYLSLLLALLKCYKNFVDINWLLGLSWLEYSLRVARFKN